MKIVLQRVLSASVTVDEKCVGKIDNGFLVLLGIGKNDTKEDADKLVKKITGLRIFTDKNDKINLSLKDVSGSILVVSQFTLYADCKKGFRPSFTNAGEPVIAEELYEYFVQQCKKFVPIVQTGVFGAHMVISLENDGPFTLLLE